jgi:hypothetical protein
LQTSQAETKVSRAETQVARAAATDANNTLQNLLEEKAADAPAAAARDDRLQQLLAVHPPAPPAQQLETRRSPVPDSRSKRSEGWANSTRRPEPASAATGQWSYCDPVPDHFEMSAVVPKDSPV